MENVSAKTAKCEFRPTNKQFILIRMEILAQIQHELATNRVDSFRMP